jgi:hypothetical protein
MFSGTKQIATDRRAALGNSIFEELTMMKSAWGPDLCDVGAWNAAQEEEVDIPEFEFEQILLDDVELEEWVTAELDADVDHDLDYMI